MSNSDREELSGDQEKQLKCKELKGFWNTSVLCYFKRAKMHSRQVYTYL